MSHDCCPQCGGKILRIKEHDESQMESCKECLWEEWQ